MTERPKHDQVVDCKWVFKIKKDTYGNVKTYKARLVAKRFTQEYEINCKETFSPVRTSRWKAVREAHVSEARGSKIHRRLKSG